MINSILNFVKWPIALLMVWSLPASLLLSWNFITAQQYSFHKIPPILIGFSVYAVLWFVIFRRKWAGSYLSTLEHEITHALFAIITGHSVKGMQITAHSGGRIEYKGGSGNWLIIIAPYFFPTVTILLLFIRPFIPQNYWLEIGIGVSIAFHIGSTFFETHGGQSDQQTVGKLFAIFFLPTANILTIIFIAAYLQSGWSGITTSFVFLFHSVSSYSIDSYHYIYAYCVK